MTDRYRHIGLEAMRGALEAMERAMLIELHQPSEEQAKDRAWRLQSAAPTRRKAE